MLPGLGLAIGTPAEIMAGSVRLLSSIGTELELVISVKLPSTWSIGLRIAVWESVGDGGLDRLLDRSGRWCEGGE